MAAQFRDVFAVAKSDPREARGDSGAQRESPSPQQACLHVLIQFAIDHSTFNTEHSTFNISLRKTTAHRVVRRLGLERDAGGYRAVVRFAAWARRDL